MLYRESADGWAYCCTICVRYFYDARRTHLHNCMTQLGPSFQRRLTASPRWRHPRLRSLGGGGGCSHCGGAGALPHRRARRPNHPPPPSTAVLHPLPCRSTSAHTPPVRTDRPLWPLSWRVLLCLCLLGRSGAGIPQPARLPLAAVCFPCRFGALSVCPRSAARSCASIPQCAPLSR